MDVRGKTVTRMDEYIEREAAIRALTLHDCDSAGAKMAICDLPAADVAPVRHGRWVDNHCTACGMMPMGDEMWKNLGFEPPLFERFMDYCPSCGAKMDGGAD